MEEPTSYLDMPGTRTLGDTSPPTRDEEVLRLHAETVQVARRTRETGSVEVEVVTRLHEHAIDEALVDRTVHIEHVPIGQFVGEMPQMREDGDTLVIPVVEEVLVTERRLFLKEEVRVTRMTTTRRHQETVVLRAEEAIVTRKRPDGQVAPNSADQTELNKETDHGQ